MNEDALKDLYRAKELYSEGRHEEALDLCLTRLDDDVQDVQAIFIMGGIFIQTGKRGLAHQLMARCLKLAPDRPEVWINYGRTLDDTPEGWEQTEYCMKHALELHPESKAARENLSALEVQRCNPEKALEYANEALAIDPESHVAHSAKGFASLMLGHWKDGWDGYHWMVGHKQRPDVIYGDLPEWDGTPGQSVIVNGEQGIGDELIYASALESMAKDCKYVVYDSMERLKGLMARSLPANVHVAGQRWHDDLEIPAHIQPTARITQAGVLRYYRLKDEDFPGTPYLRADPQMRVAMRGMLASLSHKPKVGIAWTGGTQRSRKKFRVKTLEELTPLLRMDDEVTWISLQYKDCSAEIAAYEKARGIKIHHYPWITEQKDYDYTAALVEELDLVISVPISVCQLAGGLGKEAWAMVPAITGWLYGRPDHKYVWANSVRLFRDRPVKEVAQALRAWLNEQRKAA